MKNRVIVIGGTLDLARKYCEKEGLSYPETHIAKDLQAFRGIRRGFKVILAHGFHDRDDAQRLIEEFHTRGAIIQDASS